MADEESPETGERMVPGSAVPVSPETHSFDQAQVESDTPADYEPPDFDPDV